MLQAWLSIGYIVLLAILVLAFILWRRGGPTVGYVIRYAAFAEIIGDKVHLAREIEASRQPGGDPRHRKRDSDAGGMRHLGRRLARSINRCTVNSYWVRIPPSPPNCNVFVMLFCAFRYQPPEQPTRKRAEFGPA
jgi:hypothetical protein